MSVEFNTEFFVNNRRRLQTLFTGTAPIILTANGLLQRNSDITYPFRQDSSFWYLTGIEEPDIVLVIDRNKEYLIVPDRDESRVTFDGAVDYTDLFAVSGVSEVYGEKEGWRLLESKIKKVKHVATLSAPKAYEERFGLYANPARARLTRRIKSINESAELLDLRVHLARLRMIKQPLEIAAMKRAVKITSQAFSKVKKRIDSFEHESQIHKVMGKHFLGQGVTYAYEPIIAAGLNACTLHYFANNQSINRGDLILIDVGAEVSNYAADITRTYSKGVPSKRQQAVYDAVLEALNVGINALKPGVSFQSCEDQVCDFIGEKLRELGLIKSITKESLREFYPHAPHFLGLDTHDVGDYSIPLEPGMVMTIEPGIYIPKESIGIRLEDNILITKSGCEVLSKHLPKQLD